MADLIAGTNSKAAIGFPFLTKIFAALLLGSVVAISAYLLFPTNNITAFSNVLSRSNTLTLPGRSSSQASYNGTSVSSTSENSKLRTGRLYRSKDNSTEKIAEAMAADTEKIAPNPSTEYPISNCSIPIREFAHYTQFTSHEPKPISNLDDDFSSNFFMDAGGAFSDQFSSNPQLRQTSFTDAFLGIGYQLSPNSSFKLLGGEEVFMVPGSLTINTITFIDTVFVHDSIKYQNVIGQIQSTNQPGAIRTYWIGGSYRYTVTSTGMEPYAEIFGGAATQGGIAGASIGLTLFDTYPISIDAAAFYHALFLVSGHSLTKFGADFELQYSF